MDPLLKVKEYHQKGLLNDKLFSLIVKRFNLVVEGVNRIEKASRLKFPIAYVEPSLIFSGSDQISHQFGILFARTIPLVLEDKVQVVIQVTAPLVAFGLKGTIHAVLAHEFLHYLDLIKKISDMNIVSDEISGNIFENIYSDSTRLFEPNAVFSDKTLLQHITKKFPTGFRDFKLEDKVEKFWIKKNLPTVKISLDKNTVKLPFDSLAKTNFDKQTLERLQEISQKSSKIQKKKYY